MYLGMYDHNFDKGYKKRGKVFWPAKRNTTITYLQIIAVQMQAVLF